MELPGAPNQILRELREMLIDRKDELGAYLWFDQKYYLPDDILVKSDRMSMAHAVELRPPFLDNRIVEFAAALPASSRFAVRSKNFCSRNSCGRGCRSPS